MNGFRGWGLGLTRQGKQWVWLRKDGAFWVEALKFKNSIVRAHIVDHVTFSNLCLFSACF
jgi:hypothetical protein